MQSVFYFLVKRHTCLNFGVIDYFCSFTFYGKRNWTPSFGKSKGIRFFVGHALNGDRIVKFRYKTCNLPLYFRWTGAKPQLVNGSKVQCSLKNTLDSSKWTMQKIDEDSEAFVVTFRVNIPPNALIGRWDFCKLQHEANAWPTTKIKLLQFEASVYFRTQR